MEDILMYYKHVDSNYAHEIGIKVNLPQIYEPSHEFKVDAHVENTRFFFNLCKPVLNHVKASRLVLSKITGIKSSIIEKIINFKLAVSFDGSNFAPIHECDLTNWYVGSEALLKIIDNFDIDLAIKQELTEVFRKMFIHTIHIPSVFTISRMPESSIFNLPLIKNYFLCFHLEPENVLRDKFTRESLNEHFIDYMESENTRLSLLVNMSSKDNLYGMFEDIIIVLPKAMRPVIDNRYDSLTLMYGRIYQCNEDLHTLISSSDYTLTSYIERYSNLEQAVQQMMRTGHEHKANYISVLQRISGKDNHIRNMLGKRCDFSGRSVISIDPTLKLNECALPLEMIPKLFKYHHLNSASTQVETMSILNNSDYHNAQDIVSKGLLDYLPVLLNRAPTLHKLGFQAFYPLTTEDRTIKLNPWVCEAYNADFDGDQMGVHIPISYKSITEARRLMLPSQNPFKPSTGKPIITPRHELLYGLYIATRNYSSPSLSLPPSPSLDELHTSVMNHEIKVYDIVTCPGFTKDTAGRVLVKSCFPDTMRHDFPVISKTTVEELMENLISHGIEIFEECINALTPIAFRIATLYSPSVNILSSSFSSSSSSSESLAQALKLYGLGIMDETEYNIQLGDVLRAFNDKTRSGIENGDLLNPDEGFLLFAKSGARGGIADLIQIFSHVGMVKRSATSLFPILIEKSYTEGLSPMEHYITSFGARLDIMSRSIKTAEIGYMSRVMTHVTADIYVKSVDCGTDRYITITKNDLSQHLRTGNSHTLDSYMHDIIIGRYEAITNKYIDSNYARKLMKQSSVNIRSVLTCNNSCCVKCYGEDNCFHSEVILGQPVGIVAAQSIGELGTQLSMDTFQGSGKEVATEFERVSSLLKVSSLKDNPSFPNYDPISWADGRVLESVRSNTQKYVQIGTHPKKVILPRNMHLKDTVSRGESMRSYPGDCDVTELTKYASIEKGQLYLALAMYVTYRTKDAINFKHFECLVAGMTVHYILDNGSRQDLKTCRYHTSYELFAGDIKSVRFISSIQSIVVIPSLRNSFLANIDMERVAGGLSNSLLMETKEDFSGVLESVLMGYTPKLGSYYKEVFHET